MCGAGPLVVVAAGQNPDLVRLDLIHEPMLLVNPPRPAAGQFIFQRFGLSFAAKRIALDFLNQFQNAERLLAILLDPPEQVFDR